MSAWSVPPQISSVSAPVKSIVHWIRENLFCQFVYWNSIISDENVSLSGCVEKEDIMDVTTCSRCGKLFNHISGPRICPVCLKEFDDKFPEAEKMSLF